MERLRECAHDLKNQTFKDTISRAELGLREVVVCLVQGHWMILTHVCAQLHLDKHLYIFCVFIQFLFMHINSYVNVMIAETRIFFLFLLSILPASSACLWRLTLNLIFICYYYFLKRSFLWQLLIFVSFVDDYFQPQVYWTSSSSMVRPMSK